MKSRPMSSTEPLKTVLAYKNELLLLVVAVATRVWRIDFPNSVVFDEVHFGGFVGDYHTGRYFFDIHPPLGKLSLMWIGNLLGYNAHQCVFKDIHEPFGEECRYVILRYVAAVFGCALVPMTYSIAQKLGVSVMGSVLAASCIIFDMLNLIESRLILVDSQLMFYIGASFWVALKWWERLNKLHDTGESMSPREEVAWIFAVGTACGSALSIKFTALAAPGMIAVESFSAIFFLKQSVHFRTLLGILAVIVVQFSLWYYVHFAYLPYSGEHGDGFMPIEFQRTLPEAPSVFFPWILYELNREMIAASARIDAPHHWASKHWQWVQNDKGVLYWHEHDASQPGIHRRIYILGNPMVIWGVGIGVLVFMALGLLYLRYGDSLKPSATRSRLVKSACFCFVTYVCNMAPYLAVTRQAFVYHYMPALFQAELLFALLIDLLAPAKIRDRVFMACLVTVVAAFIYWAPWVYALPLTKDSLNARQWMSNWH